MTKLFVSQVLHRAAGVERFASQLRTFETEVLGVQWNDIGDNPDMMA